MSSFTRGHRPSQSSISSLAFPLSPPLLLQLQGSLLWAGIRDASQYSRTIANIRGDPHIAASLTKCTLLQLFILVCVLGVDYLLLPAWTRGADAPGTGIGRNRVSPETAKFYFQVCSLCLLVFKTVLLTVDGVLALLAVSSGRAQFPTLWIILQQPSSPRPFRHTHKRYTRFIIQEQYLPPLTHSNNRRLSLNLSYPLSYPSHRETAFLLIHVTHLFILLFRIPLSFTIFNFVTISR